MVADILYTPLTGQEIDEEFEEETPEEKTPEEEGEEWEEEVE